MKTIVSLIAAATLVAVVALPTSALADRWHDRHDQRTEWKDLSIVGGVIGLIGAASHNPTIAALGAAGAVYGGVRFEDERWHDHDRWFYDHRHYEDRHWDDHRGGHRGW